MPGLLGEDRARAGGYNGRMPAPFSSPSLLCALAAAALGHLCLLQWLAPAPAERRMRPPVVARPPAVAARSWQVAVAEPKRPGPARPAAPASHAAARPQRAAVRVRPASAPVLAAVAGSSPASAPAVSAPVPRLKLPSSTRLHFAAQRGERSGRAELRWERTDSGSYELLLVLRYDGEEREALIQSSRGDIGEAGLQPRRYADRRGNAGLRSASFAQDDAADAPPPGAQDRLSWLVQLAAMAAAWSEPPQPGTRIVLQVAGVRGECEDWVFDVIGPEPLADAAALLHLARAPLHRYDHRIDLWLDLAGGGWPQRMSWSHPARATLVLSRENAMQQR